MVRRSLCYFTIEGLVEEYFFLILFNVGILIESMFKSWWEREKKNFSERERYIYITYIHIYHAYVYIFQNIYIYFKNIHVFQKLVGEKKLF